MNVLFYVSLRRITILCNPVSLCTGVLQGSVLLPTFFPYGRTIVDYQFHSVLMSHRGVVLCPFVVFAENCGLRNLLS